MKGKHYTYLSLIFLLYLGLLSCKNEKSSDPEPEHPHDVVRSISIGEAKDWFDEYQKMTRPDFKKDSKEKSHRKLNWSKARSKTYNQSSYVSIPLEYDQKAVLRATIRDGDFFASYQVRQKLIIYRDSKGREKMQIIHYLSRLKEWENLSEFDGWIARTDWDGTPLFSERWISGKLSQTFIPKKINPNGRMIYCENVDRGYDYTFINEEGEFTIVHVFRWELDCHNSIGNGDGGGGSTGPGVGGGGGGSGEAGGGGDSSETSADNFESYTFEITNRLSRECFRSALNQMLSSNFAGQMQQILSGIGAAQNINVIFKEGYTSTLEESGYELNKTITLSLNSMQYSSKEFIVAVALHELLHTYIKEPPGDPNWFTQWDHQVMGAMYVTPVAYYLGQMFPALQANDYEDAYALAWNGLKESAAWKMFTKTKQDELQLKIQKYWNPNNENFKAYGTHCQN